MAIFGASQKDSTGNPISQVYVPNTANSDLTALEGMNSSTDANGQTSAAARMGMKDGDNVTFGLKADTAATTDTGTFTFISLIKRLLAKFPTIGAQVISASLAVNIASDQTVGTNLKQVNGSALSVSNPVLTNDQIRALVAAGQCFRATTGVLSTGAANAFIGVQAIANALGKTCIIYNVYASPANVSGDIRQYQAANATADAGLSGTMTSGNQQPNGGAASTLVLSCSPAATTETTGFVGTQIASFGAVANTNLQLLQNGSQVYLKNGVAANASWYIKIPTSGNSAAITIEWAEL